MTKEKQKKGTLSHRIQHKKRAVLDALRLSLGVVSSACQIAKIDRSTFYKYYKEDEDFKAACLEIEDYALDFAETKLFKKIDDGDTACIIFYLKTKGKKRGYIEKQELTHTFNPVTDITITEQPSLLIPKSNGAQS